MQQARARRAGATQGGTESCFSSGAMGEERDGAVIVRIRGHSRCVHALHSSAAKVVQSSSARRRLPDFVCQMSCGGPGAALECSRQTQCPSYRTLTAGSLLLS